MANVLNRAETYDNTGSVAAVLGANYGKHSINQADVGRELVISASKTDMTNAELTAVRDQLTLAGGDGTGSDVNGPDAFTIAAIGTVDGTPFVSGGTDAVFMRVQGTGTPNLTTVGGVALAVVAVFAPAQ
jgi:hypothetical protein